MRLNTALTTLFVAFKLLGIIDWSWWWCISPSLIFLGLAIITSLAPDKDENNRRGT